MYLPTRLPETETRDAETTDPVALTLLRAAQVIRERGWCQHMAHDDEGRVCAGAAICVAMTGQPVGWAAASEAINAVTRFLRLPTTRNADVAISQWNNAFSRTADEVISALESAALSRATAISGV